MKLPISLLITLLEAEMTEEKCDQLAKKVSKFASKNTGPIGKVLGGIIYTGLDAATPEYLFDGLRAIFPDGHTVEVDASEIVEE